MPRKSSSDKSPDERKYLIVKHMHDRSLKQEPPALEQLRKELGTVSPNTLRSDIDQVFKDFQASGSPRLGPPDFLPLRFLFDPRPIAGLGEKQRLARNARNWLHREATDFFQTYVDGGTTCRILYELLLDHPPGGALATVYTNDLGTAHQASRSQQIQTLLLPGRVTRNLTLVGPDSEDFVKQREFDAAVISCSEVFVYQVKDWGTALLISTAATEEVGVKQAVINRARRVVLLVDSSKIQIPAPIDRDNMRPRYTGFFDVAKTGSFPQIAQFLAKIHPRFSMFAFAFATTDSGSRFQASNTSEVSETFQNFTIFTATENTERSDQIVSAFSAFPGVLQMNDSQGNDARVSL